MTQDLGALSGSRPTDQAPAGLGGSRFDPARKTFAFVKDDFGDGTIGVAIVQKTDGQEDGELIDFRQCAGWQEARGYLALYGLSSEPVWTKASAIEAATAGETPESGSTEGESAVAKPDAQGPSQ